MKFKTLKEIEKLKVIETQDKFIKKAIKLSKSRYKNKPPKILLLGSQSSIGQGIPKVRRMRPLAAYTSLLIIGSQGSVGKGILQAAKEEGIQVREFDRKLGDLVEKLTLEKLQDLTCGVSAIIYTAEKGNRELYDENPNLAQTNFKNFTHFTKLVSKLEQKIKIYYIGGSWTKRRIPKDFIVKDSSPNKTRKDRPINYEMAKIAAENNARRLAKSLKLDIAYFDWITIVPNYAENFTMNRFMKDLLTTNVVSYTPGKFGRPLLSAKDAGKALLLYIRKFPEYKIGQFKRILITGIFTPFSEFAKITLETAKELSKDPEFKKKAKMVKRADVPPDFLKARVESKLFKALGFRPSRKEARKALRENAKCAFELYCRKKNFKL